jgi:hypothetical protein
MPGPGEKTGSLWNNAAMRAARRDPSGSGEPSSRIPGTVFALVAAIWGAYVALSLAVIAAGGPFDRGTPGLARDYPVLLFLSFPVIGLLIARRHPRNSIGWLMLAIGASWGLWGALLTYAHLGFFSRPGAVPRGDLALALGTWLWVPAVGLMGIFLILLFPDGRLPRGRWHPLAWVSALTLAALGLQEVLAPRPFANDGFPGIENPLGIEALGPLLDGLEWVVVLLPICILGCAAAAFSRWRRSRGIERQQLKWLAAGGGVFAAFYLLFVLLAAAREAGLVGPWTRALEDSGVVVFAFVLIPVAIGIAVLRHRLYDIDVIINQALVYGALTVVLALVYLGAVLVVGNLLRVLSGQTTSTVAVAASTLAVAALFRPARAGIQGFIDRRFYRSKYDAARTVEAFTARLREEIDLEAMTDELATVVRNTMQPTHLSLWLRSTPERSPASRPA